MYSSPAPGPPPYPPPYPPPAPRRRRRRTGRGLLIALLVLVGLVIAADRVGDYVAERVAADTIKDSQHLPNTPDVGIGGFPFLTQLAAGKFEHVTIDATDVPVGNDDVHVTLSSMHVTLDDVTVDRDFSRVHADTASATGVVGFDRLSDLLHVDLSYAGDGRVRAKKSVTVLGHTYTPTITAKPTLVNGALSFGKTQINGLDDIAGQVSKVLNEVFDVDVPLQGIPFEVRVQSLQVDSKGLELRLSGADLTYTS